MKSVKTIGIAIVLFFVVYLGFGIFTSNVILDGTQPKTDDIVNKIDSVIEGCSKLKDASERTVCYDITASKGMTANNTNKIISICDLIENSEIADYCYKKVYDEIKLKSDPIFLNSLCLKIKGSVSKETCQNFILFELIPNIINKDPESVLDVCKTLSTNKYYCIEIAAKSLAYKNIDKSIDACNLLPVEQKESCYNDVLLNVPERINQYPDKSISLCSSLTIGIDQCYENIALKLMAKDPTKSVDVCRKISDIFKRNACYHVVWLNVPEHIKMNSTLSINICAELQTEVDSCYMIVASNLEDSDYKTTMEACNKISNTDSNAACLQSAAEAFSLTSKENAISACNLIKTIGARDWCLQKYK